MIKFLIFSKDRACQLDLLLRSIKEFVPEELIWDIEVLYTYSNPHFQEGYKIIQNRYPFVYLVEEKDFKKDLKELINDTYAEFVCTLVDDDVFIRKLENNQYFNKIYHNDVANLSLRLNPNMTYCYPQEMEFLAPHSTVWDWTLAEGDYSYPVSLSGTIWTKKHLQSYVDPLFYNSPNTLESAMYQCRHLYKPKMACYPENLVVNIPANRVQNTHHNRSIGVQNAITLNQAFLSGKVIDLAPLKSYKSNSCFIDYRYTFK